MALDTKKSYSHPNSCSKDHESREKISMEKRMQLMKKASKRVPAAQKMIYSVSDVFDQISNDKDKPNNSNNGNTKCSSESKSKQSKRPSQFMQSLENDLASKDPQLLEIEKQLKSINSQKKKINHLISKELRDSRSSWNDIKSKASLLNMSNVMGEFAYARKICDSLERSSKQVDDLQQSLADLNNVKSDRFSELTRAGGDRNNEVVLLNNTVGTSETDYIRWPMQKFKTAYAASPMLSPVLEDKKTFENSAGDRTEQLFADLDGARKMITRLNISTSPRNIFTYNNQHPEANGDTLMLKSRKWESGQPSIQSSHVSSQAEPNNSLSFVNKFSFSKKIPDVTKSEFLRKICFDN